MNHKSVLVRIAWARFRTMVSRRDFKRRGNEQSMDLRGDFSRRFTYSRCRNQQRLSKESCGREQHGQRAENDARRSENFPVRYVWRRSILGRPIAAARNRLDALAEQCTGPWIEGGRQLGARQRAGKNPPW